MGRTPNLATGGVCGRLRNLPQEMVHHRGQDRQGWLFGPWLDLFFIANLAWPLVLLAPLGESLAGEEK